MLENRDTFTVWPLPIVWARALYMIWNCKQVNATNDQQIEWESLALLINIVNQILAKLSPREVMQIKGQISVTHTFKCPSIV